jgi:hypothetical protein
MKTLFTFAVALSIQLATFAMSPSDQLAAHSRVSVSDQKISITLLKGIGKVKISVLDEKGMNLYTDFIKITNNAVYPINMENLPEGNYQVKISNKEGDIIKWVNVSPSVEKTNMGAASLKVIDQSQVQVTIKDTPEDLTLKIFTDSHRLLLKEEIQSGDSLNKKYNLQNISSDKVYFTLSDKNGGYRIISQ